MKANIRWLDDPETFRVNKIAANSDHLYFKNYEEWEQKRSSFIQSLDGKWQFKFSNNPQTRPLDFYKTNLDASDFDFIPVPSEIELNNYAQNQYINTLYPWEGKIFRRPAYSLGQKTDRSFSEGEDNTVGSYIKHFDLDNSFQGKHVHVFFEGVEREMFVWLNGHFI